MSVKRHKYPKTNHPKQKTNVKRDGDTNPQIAGHEGIRPWMNVLLTFSGIAIAIAAMSGIFAHSRNGAIWFTWLGVVLAITAAFIWFQNVVREHEGASQKVSSGDLTQAVTPKPTIPITTMPAPQSSSPSMQSPVAVGLAPLQILKEVDAARPLQRDEIPQPFVGIPVDWSLSFWAANRLPRDDTRWRLFFTVEKDSTALVAFDVQIKGNEYLRGVDRGETFRIKGVIDEIADPKTIHLDKVSFERVSAP